MRRVRLRRLLSIRRADIVALRWAARTLSAVRRDLATDGVHTVVAEPPDLPADALSAVVRYLYLRRATCLERSLVLQRWLSSHGTDLPVVIGVRNDDQGEFTAHAWLPGFDPPSNAVRFTELRRLEPT